jgi:hypothetical protein
MPSANHAPTKPIQLTTGPPKPEPDQEGSLGLKLNMANAKTNSMAAPMKRTISWVKRIKPEPSDISARVSFSEPVLVWVRVRSEYVMV